MSVNDQKRQDRQEERHGTSIVAIVLLGAVLFIASRIVYKSIQRECGAITTQECVEKYRILVYQQAGIPLESRMLWQGIERRMHEHPAGPKTDGPCLNIPSTKIYDGCGNAK